MSEINHGGPAFPVNELDQVSGNIVANHVGLTMRDFFAAKAMQAFMTGVDDFDEDALAESAYRMADAMLKARES